MRLLIFMFSVFTVITGNIYGQYQYFDICSTNPEELLSAGVGSIVSPGYSTVGYYPNNKNCSVTIPGDDKIIKLSIVELVIQWSDNCTKDWLKIYKNYEEVGCYRGSKPRLPIIQEFKLDNISINFYSDHFNFENFTGFKIEFLVQEPFIDICSTNDATVSDVVYINSPNFPLNYPASTECYVNVMAPTSNILKLQITAFAIPCSTFFGNWLIIRDGQNWNNIRLNEVCGTDIQFCILTPTNSVTIQFKTDDRNIAKGFSLLIKALPSGTTPESVCPPNITTTTVSITQPDSSLRNKTSTILEYESTFTILGISTMHSPAQTVKTPTTVKHSNTISKLTTTAEPTTSSTISDEKNMNNSEAGAVTHPDGSTGTIIGSIVGGIVFTLTIIISIFGVCRRLKKPAGKRAQADGELNTFALVNEECNHQDADTVISGKSDGGNCSGNLLHPNPLDNIDKLYAKPQEKKQTDSQVEKVDNPYAKQHERKQKNPQIVHKEDLYAKPQTRKQESQLEQTVGGNDYDYGYGNIGDNQDGTSDYQDVYIDDDEMNSQRGTSEDDDEVHMIENDLYSAADDLSDNSDHMEITDNDIYSRY